MNKCNTEIFWIKLVEFSNKNFISEIEQQMVSTGKWVYKVYPTAELCKYTGWDTSITIYIGHTTDLAERLYRPIIRGMDHTILYQENMQWGRELLEIIQAHASIPDDIKNNLWKYFEVRVIDFTDTDVDIKCWEANEIVDHKVCHGRIPMMNKQEAQKSTISLGSTRKWWSEPKVEGELVND